MTIGQRIAERRKLLGISQEALGEKLEVSRQSVFKWESDAAIPEIDKLIALSKLFGVTVGWLLGTEEQPGSADGISEEQMKTIEELIRRYSGSQEKKPPKRDARQIVLSLAALCLGLASLVMSLHALARNNDLFPNYQSQLNALSRENSVIQDQLEDVTAQLQQLMAGEQLVTEHSIAVTAWDDYQGATVTVTAMLKATQPGDQVWLSVRQDDKEAATQLCEADGSGYRAAVELPAADDYSYYLLVVHTDGSKEQQLLLSADTGYDVTAVYLESMLTCYTSAEASGWKFSRGTLELQNVFVAADPPSIMAENDWPRWESLELVLLHNSREISREDCLEQAWGWMEENLTIAVPDGAAEEKYMDLLWINGNLGTRKYTLPALAEGDTVELRIKAVLSNGLTAENTVSQWEFQNGILREA